MNRLRSKRAGLWLSGIAVFLLLPTIAYAEETVVNLSSSQLKTWGLPPEAVYRAPFLVELTAISWFLPVPQFHDALCFLVIENYRPRVLSYRLTQETEVQVIGMPGKSLAIQLLQKSWPVDVAWVNPDVTSNANMERIATKITIKTEWITTTLKGNPLIDPTKLENIKDKELTKDTKVEKLMVKGSQVPVILHARIATTPTPAPIPTPTMTPIPIILPLMAHPKVVSTTVTSQPVGASIGN